MNINTELVKNKKYNVAILHELVKVSQEYRVLATLRYLFPGVYEQMEHGDKPDLQDKTNKVGIEVTATVQENDMKANRVLAEFDETSSEKLTKDLDKIINCGYDINIIYGKKSISRSGTVDSEKSCFQNAILKKCKKADQYKADYAKIGLAVLLPEIPTSYAEDHLIDWVKELHSEIDKSFDFIYVISCRFCLLYDILNGNTDKKSLKSSDNQLLCIIARMTAEEELTLDSIEWK